MRSAFLSHASKAFYSAFVDLVFPSSCVGCSNFGPLICQNCLQKIGIAQNTCVFCDAKTLHGKTCYQCQTKNSLAGVISVGKYQNVILRNAVHDLKFSGVQEIAEPLSNMLVKNILQTLSSSLSEFTLVSLPLHPIRKRERGFNQAGLLAQKIATKLSLPCQEILIRTRATKPQAKIDHKTENLRKENIAKAFAVDPAQTKIPEKIIIIDDVATSGATLEEAAKTLHQAGVKEIWGAVICRG
jgi:ComF family protein